MARHISHWVKFILDKQMRTVSNNRIFILWSEIKTENINTNITDE